MRLNRLPLELTIGNNLRGPENGCEKQCSDWIAGKYQVYGNNIQYKDSQSLQRLSMGSNGELLENLYSTKIEGNLDSHSKTSHSSKKSLNFFDYTYSTNNCDFLNLHAQSEYKKAI